MFQSTLPRGERPQLPGVAFLYPQFQSTLPRGERLREPSQQMTLHLLFQSTLPRGERPSVFVWFCTSLLCFNPRSRVGSDRKATFKTGMSNSFNPRSRVGSDRKFRIKTRHIIFSFNPRSRVGSDPQSLFGFVPRYYVSIHAPAWGATSSPRCGKGRAEVFQSTLPRGERPRWRSYTDNCWCFNPRSRVGSD